MNSIYKTLIGGLFACLLFSSCEDKDERTVFPHSTPVIESATINPSSFSYGDSVTIIANVSDPTTPLSTLEMKMVINDVLVAQQSIRTEGKNAEVSSKFKVPFMAELPDGTNVEIILSLINVEGDQTNGSIANVKGKRKYFNKLYLVLDDGTVYPLTSQSLNPDMYNSDEILIKSNNIRYRIAEKLTSENQIDFDGYVWGIQNGAVQLVDESGDYISTANTSLDYITNVVFDSYLFTANISGDKYNPNDLVLDNFGDVTVSNEAFKKLSRSFVKDQEINLYGDLTSSDIVYNMDYFERIADDKVKFIGEEGSYDLYFSETRKFMLVEPANREYPNILLVAGVGLGYPSKVKLEAHTAWDFNAPLQAIVFSKVAADIYQATVYFDATQVNFKPFENSGWGNEKKSDDFTLPSILINSQQHKDLVDPSASKDGNWYAAPDAVSGIYKITIDMATNVVTAESVTLP